MSQSCDLQVLLTIHKEGKVVLHSLSQMFVSAVKRDSHLLSGVQVISEVGDLHYSSLQKNHLVGVNIQG